MINPLPKGSPASLDDKTLLKVVAEHPTAHYQRYQDELDRRVRRRKELDFQICQDDLLLLDELKKETAKIKLMQIETKKQETAKLLKKRSKK